MTRLALLITAGLAAGACSPAEPADYVRPPTGPLPDESVYQLDTEWQRHSGGVMRLNDLRGRPVLLAMTFTNCASACPMIVRDMQRLEAAMPEPLQAGVRFVLVSLDPARDTPEAMRAFASVHGLDDRWHLLRGSAEDTRTLSAAIDVRYRDEGTGQIAHSNSILLLEANGVVAARADLLGADAEPLVARLERAMM